MTLREMLIHSVAEFAISIGKSPTVDSFIRMSDEELLKQYRNNVYDEGYADGHYDGYSAGLDEMKTSNEIRLN